MAFSFGFVRKLTFTLVAGVVSACFLFAPNATPLRAQSEPEVSVPVEFSSESAPTFAADEYSLGKVLEVVRTGQRTIEGYTQEYQVSRIELLSGAERGKKIDIEHSILTTGGQPKVQVGQTVVMVKINSEGSSSYFIADDYRLPALAFIFGIFILLTFIFARRKGLMSLFGLALSVAVIMLYVVPRIAVGENPLFVSLTGAIGVMFVSMYLAHGFALRTTVALVATSITFAIAIGLAYAFVVMGRLYGFGSDEAMFLQLGSVQGINLRGLLLGGILFGVLGVLDDVTTAQVATVEELKLANPSFGVKELYRRGLSVGREHITSLVNTLFLAYAGASLPLFLLFTTIGTQPWWVIMNGEIVAEEIVRTLVGSTVLVLAVPIATLLAAVVMANIKVSPQAEGSVAPEKNSHHHH